MIIELAVLTMSEIVTPQRYLTVDKNPSAQHRIPLPEPSRQDETIYYASDLPGSHGVSARNLPPIDSKGYILQDRIGKPRAAQGIRQHRRPMHFD